MLRLHRKQSLFDLRLALVAVVALTMGWIGDSASAFARQEKAATVPATDDEVAQVQDADQDEEDGDDAVQGQVIMNALGIQPGQLQAAKKFQLTQLLAVEIEELRRVCELNEKQLLKLRIASKGAVKNSAADWIKKFNNQNQGVGIQGAETPDETQEPVIRDADELDENTVQIITINTFTGNPFRFDDPRDTPFWKKTVSSVLSTAQQEKFDQFKSDRMKQKRDSLIKYSIQTITTELGLSEIQATQFDELLRPILKDANFQCPAFYENYLSYYYASKVDEKQLKSVLSPAQLQKWKLFIAPAKQLGPMMENE